MTDLLLALFSEAESAERKYDWLAAARLYKERIKPEIAKSSGVFPPSIENSGSSVQIAEKIARCYYRAAYQAENEQLFKQGMNFAIETLETAAKELEASRDERIPSNDANRWTIYFRSYASFLRSRLVPETNSEMKKNLLTEALTLADEGLNFSATQLDICALKCWNIELQALEDISILKPKGDFLRKTISKVIETTQRLLLTFSAGSEEQRKEKIPDFCAILYRSALFCNLGRWLFEEESERNNVLNLRDVFTKNADREVSSIRNDDFLCYAEFLPYRWDAMDMPPSQLLEEAQELFPMIEATKDKQLITFARIGLFHGSVFSLRSEENLEIRREKLLALIKIYKEMTSAVEVVQVNAFCWEWLMICCNNLVTSLLSVAKSEIDERKRESLLREAIQFAREGLGWLGTMSWLGQIEAGLSQVFSFKARIEQSQGEAYRALEEAIRLAKASQATSLELEPYFFWNRGVHKCRVAELEFRISQLEKDLTIKIDGMKKAIESSKEGLAFMRKLEHEAFRYMGNSSLTNMADYSEQLFRMLSGLYDLTRDKKLLDEQIEILNALQSLYERLGLPVRLAQIKWQIGNVQGLLSEYERASENYLAASDAFSKAGQIMPSFSNYFRAYSFHARALAEAEMARQAHSREDYPLAKERYRRASELIGETGEESWTYLKDYFEACVLFELAEESSWRNTSTIEHAQELFEKAGARFASTIRRAEELASPSADRLVGPVTAAEQTFPLLREAAIFMEKYCSLRALIQKARLDYMHGRTLDSIRTYSRIIGSLQDIQNDSRDENWLKEIGYLSKACEANQELIGAEMRSSPDRFERASKLFEEAASLTRSHRQSLGAMSDSYYSLALSNGSKFVVSGQMENYAAAKSCFTQSESLLSKLGEDTSRKWLEGSERLLDAYVFTKNAFMEADPLRKAKNLEAAEKMLESSAKLFDSSGFLSKKDSVLGLLAKVKEEKNLALSISTVFISSPLLPSASMTDFSSPPPVAPGMSTSFTEGSRIQLAIETSVGEVGAGEPFNLKIDLVNTGQGAAILLQLEGFLPKGLELAPDENNPSLISVPGSVNHSSVAWDFKGKKLSPFEIASVNLAVRSDPLYSEIEMNPRVKYIDERDGAVKLKDLGKSFKFAIRPKFEFEFESEQAKLLFDHLVNQFFKDYMLKKMPQGESGWQTLGEIAKAMNLPLSTVYSAKGFPAFVNELSRRGLIETRIYTGVRGRGGESRKIRIDYEKDAVREYVNKKVTKSAK
jgi:tetratricopeptide (TPR) repeat protein